MRPTCQFGIDSSSALNTNTGLVFDGAIQPFYSDWMNRIREHREAKGWSQAELAVRVDTTQATIQRIESGQRKLTHDWMRAIAKALEVSPADLITSPTLGDFNEEARPYAATGEPVLLRALDRLSLVPMEITSDALESLGLTPGTVRMFDLSAHAVAAVKTGDVVIVQLYDAQELLKATTVIRQFIAPGLLTTNRRGTNQAFTLENSAFEAVIKGVMVRDDA